MLRRFPSRALILRDPIRDSESGEPGPLCFRVRCTRGGLDRIAPLRHFAFSVKFRPALSNRRVLLELTKASRLDHFVFACNTRGVARSPSGRLDGTEFTFTCRARLGSLSRSFLRHGNHSGKYMVMRRNLRIGAVWVKSCDSMRSREIPLAYPCGISRSLFARCSFGVLSWFGRREHSIFIISAASRSRQAYIDHQQFRLDSAHPHA